MVKVKPGAKVITIEPTADALSMEGVVKLFSTAFEPASLFDFRSGLQVPKDAIQPSRKQGQGLEECDFIRALQPH